MYYRTYTHPHSIFYQENAALQSSLHYTGAILHIQNSGVSVTITEDSSLP